MSVHPTPFRFNFLSPTPPWAPARCRSSKDRPDIDYERAADEHMIRRLFPHEESAPASPAFPYAPAAGAGSSDDLDTPMFSAHSTGPADAPLSVLRLPSSTAGTPTRALFSPTCGPTPGAGRRPKDVKNTAEREEDRGRHRRALSFESPYVDVMTNQLLENSYLAEALRSRELETKIKTVDSSLSGKCFSKVQVILYRKEDDLSGLVELAAERIDQLFISSATSCIKPGTAGLVGVDKNELRSCMGKDRPVAIMDHHSERATLQWLDKNIVDITRRLLGSLKGPIPNDLLVHINIITLYSSCRCCSLVMGIEDKSSRIPDALRKRLSEELASDSELCPDVTMIHQGLAHYHHETKGIKELPKAEFFASTSFLKC